MRWRDSPSTSAPATFTSARQVSIYIEHSIYLLSKAALIRLIHEETKVTQAPERILCDVVHTLSREFEDYELP